MRAKRAELSVKLRMSERLQIADAYLMPGRAHRLRYAFHAERLQAQEDFRCTLEGSDAPGEHA